MWNKTPNGQRQADEPMAAPTACPACRSSEVTTTSKVVSSETYWRCVRCGEIWNVARREANQTTAFGAFRR